MDATVLKQLRRLRTLGRGASGAVVWLASDDESGEVFAVKSAGAAGAAQLRREGSVLAGLCSPHIVPCLGTRAAGGEYQLFLEFAPGGSLADEVARSGSRLDEGTIRAYAADVASGLAYLHGRSLVHGDVKGRNVVVGADGRAKLTDFGCARRVGSVHPIGGTPAFMAPEVARGEEQGPAADVWALGCTVVEMATGRAPWSDMDDVVAAVHRIGYTDVVPEVPGWLSPEAKDFLAGCLKRHPSDRCTAAQLLDHPFLSFARNAKAEPAKQDWVSPKSTLDAALWESEIDDEADDKSESPADRIRSLACPGMAFPDWDSDEGWIQMHSYCSEVCDSPAAKKTAGATDCCAWDETSETEAATFNGDVGGSDPVISVGVPDVSTEQDVYSRVNLASGEVSSRFVCNGNETVIFKCACCNGNGAIKFSFANLLCAHCSLFNDNCRRSNAGLFDFFSTIDSDRIYLGKAVF